MRRHPELMHGGGSAGCAWPGRRARDADEQVIGHYGYGEVHDHEDGHRVAWLARYRNQRSGSHKNRVTRMARRKNSHRGRDFATLPVTGGASLGLRYPVTSIISEAFAYRAAFWFGVLGACLLSLAVVDLMVVLSEGGQGGLTSPLSLAMTVGCPGCSPPGLPSGEPSRGEGS
jgi:hypothetical protein